MGTENKDKDVNENNESGADIELMKTQMAELLAENERLKNHSEKVLKEKKSRDEAIRQAEAEKLLIAEKAAKESGDLEALEKSLTAKIQAKDDELAKLKSKIDNDKVENESLKIASQLTDNQHNQKILQRLAKDRLSVVDGEVIVLDENGQPPISKLDKLSIDGLLNEFKTSGAYDSLISGTKGSGSGGSGNNGGAKTLADYSEQELIELANSNQPEFERVINS